MNKLHSSIFLLSCWQQKYIIVSQGLLIKKKGKTMEWCGGEAIGSIMEHSSGLWNPFLCILYLGKKSYKCLLLLLYLLKRMMSWGTKISILLFYISSCLRIPQKIWSILFICMDAINFPLVVLQKHDISHCHLRFQQICSPTIAKFHSLRATHSTIKEYLILSITCVIRSLLYCCSSSGQKVTWSDEQTHSPFHHLLFPKLLLQQSRNISLHADADTLCLPCLTCCYNQSWHQKRTLNTCMIPKKPSDGIVYSPCNLLPSQEAWNHPNHNGLSTTFPPKK